MSAASCRSTARLQQRCINNARKSHENAQNRKSKTKTLDNSAIPLPPNLKKTLISDFVGHILNCTRRDINNSSTHETVQFSEPITKKDNKIHFKRIEGGRCKSACASDEQIARAALKAIQKSNMKNSSGGCCCCPKCRLDLKGMKNSKNFKCKQMPDMDEDEENSESEDNCECGGENKPSLEDTFADFLSIMHDTVLDSVEVGFLFIRF